MDLIIEGARAIIGDRVEETAVTISGSQIAEIGGGSGRRIDARGLILAPAMVDIHGDAFERQMAPRPNVYFPTDAALLETDRQLAANGVATAYHALTLSWEPGLRSIEAGQRMIDGLAALAPRFTVENRVQLRWETFAFEAIDMMKAALAGPLTPSIAFNDHTSMPMRPFDMPVTERPFMLAEDQAVSLDDPRMAKRLEKHAQRSGMSLPDYIALSKDIWTRRRGVLAKIEEVAAAGRTAGAPMLSHDDSQMETRDYFSALGSNISEFPMHRDIARAAKARGEWVVLGAPNAVRGGSHIGSLGAADMVEADLCDILASDYYYPAMLAAVARMARERRAPLPALWSRVAANPAQALGLTDRGEIAVGKRADLVLIDWPEDGTPAIVATFSAGKLAYLSRDIFV